MRRWKAVLPGEGDDWELYDIDQDISESIDLAEQYPDVLSLLQSIAGEAHRPVLPGDIYDEDLAKKDHSQAPN